MTRIAAVDATTPGAIQAAVDRLGDGGVVHLGPGEFHVDTTVVLHNGITVQGSGADATTIVLDPGSNCHVFTNRDHDTGNHAIAFRGFTLEGDMRNQSKPAGASGITYACGGYFKRVRDLVIENITAHEIRQTAFHFNHCDGVRIRRLRADELGWSGVSTSGTDDIVLIDVVVTNSGLDVRHSGIHLDGGTGAYVEATVDGCTGNGIMLDSKFSALSDVVVRGVARRALRGLSLSGAGDKELTTVYATGDFSNNRQCGVLVSNATNVMLVGATISTNGEAGVIIQGKSGSAHCVVADCTLLGNPVTFVERDDASISYITGTIDAPGAHDTEPIVAAPKPTRRPTAPARKVARNIRNRVRKVVPARSTLPSPVADAPADGFDGTCPVCGTPGHFERANPSLREGYRCTTCKASLRYQGQAATLIQRYSTSSAASIAALVGEQSFRALHIWEPGVLGAMRQYFKTLPHYVMSDYWPDVEPGDERDGVRCEDMMALTFANESFDLVITSDIFEHVRHPYVGFTELHRVLRPGGAHIFSIPVQEPMRAATVERVDVSGEDDVYVLEPRYHLGPGNSQHIVYNDFGRDLVNRLEDVGFDTDVIPFESDNPEAARLLTFCSVRR
jgi:hypothetical protein